ncbi:MAG TPA: hypothetical protein PKA02_03320 [Candidatus Saccharibacteria bacterium]|nr:hypothetical protein [Candidatus Saccharibacteria bacterium]
MRPSDNEDVAFALDNQIEFGIVENYLEATSGSIRETAVGDRYFRSTHTLGQTEWSVGNVWRPRRNASFEVHSSDLDFIRAAANHVLEQKNRLLRFVNRVSGTTRIAGRMIDAALEAETPTDRVHLIDGIA